MNRARERQRSGTAILAFGLIVLSPLYADAAPSKFKSVREMMQEFHDYSAEKGTFKVLKSDPLHIRLSPQVVQGHSRKVIEALTKRALIYGIYRTFIHTDVSRVTVTAVPQEIDFKSDKARYLTKYSMTMTKTRDQALAVARKHLRVQMFSDLVLGDGAGEMAFPDTWTEDFSQIYYDDEWGLSRFVLSLEEQK